MPLSAIRGTSRSQGCFDRMESTVSAAPDNSGSRSPVPATRIASGIAASGITPITAGIPASRVLA